MKKEKKKSDKSFPGYPHYSKKEDIYNNAAETKTDPEQLNRDVRSTIKKNKREPEKDYVIESPVPDSLLTDEEEISRNEHEITSDDLIALGGLEDDNDGGEDELLKKERIYPIDMAGDDLDIPGTDEDDDREVYGEEDEENNLYSQPD